MSVCDQELLTALLAKDLHRYFDQLITMYQQKLFVFILFKVRHRQDAEDIIQETFAQAYRWLRSSPTSKILNVKLRPWLFTIAYHCAINYLTREKKHTSQEVSIDCSEVRALLEETIDGQALSPEREAEEKEAYYELYACIQQLPDPLRLPVILHCIIELGYREVAEILHQPFNTTKSNGRRGIEKLQKMLQQKDSPGEEEVS